MRNDVPRRYDEDDEVGKYPLFQTMLQAVAILRSVTVAVTYAKARSCACLAKARSKRADAESPDLRFGHCCEETECEPDKEVILRLSLE